MPFMKQISRYLQVTCEPFVFLIENQKKGNTEFIFLIQSPKKNCYLIFELNQERKEALRPEQKPEEGSGILVGAGRGVL
jgi:hypothetical protein